MSFTDEQDTNSRCTKLPYRVGPLSLWVGLTWINKLFYLNCLGFIERADNISMEDRLPSSIEKRNRVKILSQESAFCNVRGKLIR